MIGDLSIIFFCYILTWLWVLISLTFVLPQVKHDFFDGGWGMLRLVSWLTTGLVIWFLAHFGIPVNTRLGFGVLTLLLISYSLKTIKDQRLNLRQILIAKKIPIIASEILFLIGFFGLSLLRGFSPEINNLEKFMDAGLMISYMKSPTLPIEDMWLSGHTFNYYTFGHY